MLDMLIAMASKDINVERNEKIFRAAEVRSFAGSAEKLKRDTGWHTVFGVQAALLETLNWWRNI
jgi:nucleoside-diphosphate-sugar epimerase